MSVASEPGPVGPAVRFKGYSFCYPTEVDPALEALDLELVPGSFNVLCGLSGSGKTTLLRSVKPELTPVGRTTGSVEVFGLDLTTLTAAESAGIVGFVMQNPENQLVMDTVWHELAFGLENLGVKTEVMRRRVAETAHFFGIGAWFDKKTSELSGGQKQILNLAAVITMQAKILVLDEPTAQLDPIAAKEFLQMLGRVNVELGMTVLVCEHSLEDVLPLADRVLFLDHGKLIYDAVPRDFVATFSKEDNPFLNAFPSATRIVDAFGDATAFPLTVKEGREWLHTELSEGRLVSSSQTHAPVQDNVQCAEGVEMGKSVALLQAENIWFRYDKEGAFVLQNASLAVERGSIHAILGGNGCGKSTLLLTLAGVRKPMRGSVRKMKGVRVGTLPQDPRALFVCNTVREDLCEWQARFGYSDEDVDAVLEKLGLAHLAQRHPYDLSGGETQKAALAKLLLLKPDVLLLDEPVKGVDIVAKHEIGGILSALKEEGHAIVFVTHDLEFAANFADRCSMMFGGAVTCSDTGHDFFSGNMFFTTGFNRITRMLLDGCVVLDDITARLVRAHGEA